MAIQCSGCGRGYDATLFEFGRTIRCACGERVGLAHRLRIDRETGVPRFFADAMLEKLARWLRLLGFDCGFERGIADADLVRRAMEERRIILTRDRDLAQDWRIDSIVEVPGGSTFDQLTDLVERFSLAGELRPYSRCSRCNVAVEKIGPEEVIGRIPERIRAMYEQYIHCPGCGAVHWAGSHTDRINRVIDSLRGV